MAIVTRRTRKGLMHTAVYRTVDGTQKSAGTFPDRKKAKAAYTQAVAKVQRGSDPSAPETVVYPAQGQGGETVSAFAARWLPEHRLEPHSRRAYKSMLHAHINPRFGATAVSALTTRDIALWLRGLQEDEEKSLDTVTKIKSVLSALCQAAAEEGLLSINPTRGIRLGKETKKKRKPLEHDEYAKLRAELDPHWHLLTDLIVKSGVRWEEAMALKKSDLEGDVLWIGAVLNELRNPAVFLYKTRTKTGKGRQVVLPPDLVSQIQNLPEGYLFLMPGRKHKGLNCAAECRDPAHIHNDWWRVYVWQRAMKAIGMEIVDGIVPRDMRRTHATWLRKAGASLEIVQQQLGHTQLTTTIGYLGEVPDSARKAAGYINW